MMFRRRFFMGVLLFGLLLLGIFAAAGGRSSYRSGWMDGYLAAQTDGATAQGETAAAAETQPVPPARGHAGWGFHPIGWFFGGLLMFWLFLFIVGTGLKLLFWGFWRRGRRHHHRHHGRDHHGPPWQRGDNRDEPYEKSPEDVGPDIRSY